jgi:hypothetical protein
MRSEGVALKRHASDRPVASAGSVAHVLHICCALRRRVLKMKAPPHAVAVAKPSRDLCALFARATRPSSPRGAMGSPLGSDPSLTTCLAIPPASGVPIQAGSYF